MLKYNSNYIGTKGKWVSLSWIVHCKANGVFAVIRSAFLSVLVLIDISEGGSVINQYPQYGRPIYSIAAKNDRFGFDCSDSTEMRRFTKSSSEIFHPLNRCHLSVSNPVLLNEYVNSSVDSLNFIFCDNLSRCVTIENQQILSVQYLQLESPRSRPNETLGVLIHLIPAVIVIGLAVYFAQGLKAL